MRVGAALSLSGRFARFGAQAAAGLDTWRRLAEGVDVVIEDDESDRDRVRPVLDGLAERCDLLLGPYSTVLMRAAAETGHLIWNHGGSGDDVQAAAPGFVVSVLTPTRGYAEPFVRHVAGLPERLPLRLARGRGAFARQVIAGAEAAARRHGLAIGDDPAEPHDLFSAGTFEDDVTLVTAALGGSPRPRTVGSVAAGVHEFRLEVPACEGVFGVAQWIAGSSFAVDVGPTEAEFLAAHRDGSPDYPAVQAAATAAIAVHCARRAGSTSRMDLWRAATHTTATTLFGAFAVDPDTGAQVAHRMALVQWRAGELTAHTLG